MIFTASCMSMILSLNFSGPLLVQEVQAASVFILWSDVAAVAPSPLTLTSAKASSERL